MSKFLEAALNSDGFVPADSTQDDAFVIDNEEEGTAVTDHIGAI